MKVVWNKVAGKGVKTLAACTAAVIAAACAKENGASEAPASVEMENMVLEAAVSPTRTSLGSDDSVLWTAGDALSVFSTTAASPLNNQFTLSGEAGASASFEGQVEAGTTTFVALYPYTAGAAYSNGTITGAAIPAAQTATAGSFCNGASLALASGTRQAGSHATGLSFSNLCAVISFKLPSDIDFASSIDVETNGGGKIAGDVTICNGAIASASASKVTLSGSFEGGKTYYVTVAPGTYNGGFRFTIHTKGDNSYVRENTYDVVAAAGTIYPLGTLSLALGQADFTHSVSISHNYSSQTLLGSTARLSVEVNKSDLAHAVREIRVENVKLERNSVTYCTLSSFSVGGFRLSQDMTNNSSTPYIPKGDYSYSADVYYTVATSAGNTTERNVRISGSASSVSPDATKFTVDVNLSGYTSYSCYKGTDGQSASASTANGKDNATIYGVGATYKNGLTPAVYNQCSSLLSFKTYIDNVEHSGDVGSQSWAAHTISASVSFDGSNPTTCPTTKAVFVTGLPYNPNNTSVTSFKGDWSFSGGTSAWDDGEKRFKLRNGATATFKGFYIPDNIDGTVNYRIEAYVSTRINDLTTVFNVGSTSVINATISGTAKTVEYKSTSEVSFSSTKNTMTCQSKGSSSSWATSQVWGYRFGVTYR